MSVPADYRVVVVLDMESGTPTLLGTYARTDEDAIVYVGTDGRVGSAPCDCVRTVTLELP